MASLVAIVRAYWVAITVFTLAAITTLSLYPLEHLPVVRGSDKTHHLIAYGAVMFPTALRKPKYWLLMGVFFAFWGGAIELIQPYVNRYGESLDVAANITGLGCGLLVAWIINWFGPINLQGDDHERA
ncbi:MAG: hypothetical protein KC426_10075 [Oceanospirillaceae bacterium]|nr:hypothetical protein [Oceanospirillaceae bacterium]